MVLTRMVLTRLLACILFLAWYYLSVLMYIKSINTPLVSFLRRVSCCRSPSLKPQLRVQFRQKADVTCWLTFYRT